MLKRLGAIAAILLWATPAIALEVEEAGVEKGEIELVYEGTYTDDNGEGAYNHEHEIEVEIGATDWLKFAFGIGFEEEEGERNFEFSEIEGAVTLELVDPETAGYGLALFGRLSEEIAAESGEPNEREFALGVIAENTFNNVLFRGNLFYTSDIGAEADEQFDGVEYAYRISYQLSESYGIGVEGYGDHKDLDDPNEEDVSRHKIGPVFYFSRELEHRAERVSMKDTDDDDEEGLELEGQLGVLFGTTDETADVTLKWNLGLEF